MKRYASQLCDFNSVLQQARALGVYEDLVEHDFELSFSLSYRFLFVESWIIFNYYE